MVRIVPFDDLDRRERGVIFSRYASTVTSCILASMDKTTPRRCSCHSFLGHVTVAMAVVAECERARPRFGMTRYRFVAIVGFLEFWGR